MSTNAERWQAAAERYAHNFSAHRTPTERIEDAMGAYALGRISFAEFERELDELLPLALGGAPPRT